MKNKIVGYAILSTIVLILFTYYSFWGGLILLSINLLLILLTIVILFLNKKVKTTYWYQQRIPNLNNYPNNEWYRSNLTRNYDIVILGSSSAKYSYRINNMNIKFFNWANTPQSLLYSYKILRSYFSILKNNGLVIITLCPFSGLKVEGKWSIEQLLKYYYILPYDELPRTLYETIKKRVQFPLVYDTKKSIKALLRQNSINSEKHTKESKFRNDSNKWINIWKSEFNITDFEQPLSEYNVKGRNDRIKLLHDMISFCLERDLKPILVIPPIHKTLSEKFSDKFCENYIYKFIKEGNKLGVPFYNYMFDDRFNKDEYFTNSYFMNEKGAEYFTKEFLKEINLI